MKGVKNYLKKFGKMVLIDLGIVAVILVIGAGFFLFTNYANAESFTTLSDLPGLETGSEAPSLGEFVNIIFRMAIGLGAVIAVLMIVIGGFQYLSTDMFQTKGAARERITNSLLGLGLLLTSFLFLQTINPKLLDLDVKIDSARIDIQTQLTADNLDEFINQQKLRAAAFGGEETGCRDTSWSYEEYRTTAVEWVTNNYGDCRARLAQQPVVEGRTYSPECYVTTRNRTDLGDAWTNTTDAEFKSPIYQICFNYRDSD